MKKLLLFLFLLCFSLSVKAQSSCPDNNHPHMIDLGLESGTLWACCNVGASKPEDVGGYYAWGETEMKSEYDYLTYKHFDQQLVEYINIGDDITGTKYDVAHVIWGNLWIMPNFGHIMELEGACELVWTTINGHEGILVTGPSYKSIFLPAAGVRLGEDLEYNGVLGCYWSGWMSNKLEEKKAVMLLFKSSDWTWDSQLRQCGMQVRPVCPKAQK